jgi:hypothetical protein
MSTASTAGSHGHSDDYMQPECAVGHKHPGFRHGCPACPYPGYQHPVLGWVPKPCACAHHQAEEAAT